MAFDIVTSLAVIFIVFIFLFTLCGSGKKDKEYRANSILKQFKARHMNVIVDQFSSLSDVTQAIRKAGLESSNIIFGVDFTASNAYQGAKTFQGRSLHAIQAGVSNPYQQVISIIGRTLEPFDEDGTIPAFGFGDLSTKDRTTFPFRQQGYCIGFRDVLAAYSEIAPNVKLSGPTSFAPIIHRAIDIIKHTRSFHILVIVADGQVTSEKSTRDAIVAASHWPLSIVLIGVGDGPWDMMAEFDDSLPQRRFDNFQFVDYHNVMKNCTDNPDPAFALSALMELPDQYKQMRRLGLLDF